MKQMKTITILFFLFCTVLLSCQSNTEGQSEEPNKDNKNLVVSDSLLDTIYIDTAGNKYPHLVQIPDSLRTSEQKELITKLQGVLFQYIAVKNNRMIFELSKKDFVAKGIPGRYYDQIQKNLLDNNTFFETEGTEDVDKMIEKLKEDYYQILQKKQTAIE